MAETIYINYFEEYLDKIQSIVESKKNTFLYRGHREESWQLVPSIARKTNNIALLKTETELLADFKRRMLPFLPHSLNIDSKLELLALAQHHDLPTRLLDWSENPLAALFFAFQDDKGEPKTKEGKIEEFKVDKPREVVSNTNRTVWVLETVKENFLNPDKKNYDPFKEKGTKIYKPNQVSQRIITQSGWFTLHYFDNNTNKFNPLDENPSYKKGLYKFVFPDNIRNSVLNRLDSYGINIYSIYPDLVGLSNYLKWKYIESIK